MLLRQVQKLGWDPLTCQYELVAFGPIFPEQADLTQHRSKRDIIAPLETELALLFKSEGFTVVGSHGKQRSEEHTSELQSLMRISYAVFCLKKNNTTPSLSFNTQPHTKH